MYLFITEIYLIATLVAVPVINIKKKLTPKPGDFTFSYQITDSGNTIWGENPESGSFSLLTADKQDLRPSRESGFNWRDESACLSTNNNYLGTKDNLLRTNRTNLCSGVTTLETSYQNLLEEYSGYSLDISQDFMWRWKKENLLGPEYGIIWKFGVRGAQLKKKNPTKIDQHIPGGELPNASDITEISNIWSYYTSPGFVIGWRFENFRVDVETMHSIEKIHLTGFEGTNNMGRHKISLTMDMN